MTAPHLAPRADWNRLPITSVEDVQQAVLGAGLDAVQLSCGPMRGSLAFATSDGMSFSSGHLTGRVSLTGPLSDTMVTLGVGIRMTPGSRHWMNEVETGGVGIFRAGDTHEAIYLPGTIYACVTLPDAQLEEIAADMGLVLDAAQLGGSRISRRRLSSARFVALERAFVQVHTAGEGCPLDAVAVGRFMLDSLIEHLAREPRRQAVPRDMGAHSRIVARARRYIIGNLMHSISISALARASFASQSTLYRAFHEVLDETPQSFIRKLRLNRIRQDIATEEEAGCTITILANKWGVAELGRFAGWYRELFGELPSHTRARRFAMVQAALAPRTV